MCRQRMLRVVFLALFAIAIALVLWILLPPAVAIAAEAPSPAISRESSRASSAGERCELCHAAVLAASHPMNVVAQRATIPAGWPLDSAGRITCATCHSGCERGPSRDARESAGLREGLSGWSFCARCHQGRDGEILARIVPIAARAHDGQEAAPAEAQREKGLEHARYLAVAHLYVSQATEGLDDTSRKCLGCHDGAVAASSDVELEAAPRIGGLAGSHPVGIPYPLDVRRYTDSQYVPRASLNPRIILPDGKLGCLSCHNLYGGEEKLLVMSNRESRLCYACHEL